MAYFVVPVSILQNSAFPFPILLPNLSRRKKKKLVLKYLDQCAMQLIWLFYAVEDFFLLILQATLAPPVKGKIFKGLCVCYAVLIATFFCVAISGYWAFGKQSKGLILSNFLDQDGNALVPKGFILITNLFTILQLSAVSVVKISSPNSSWRIYFLVSRVS